LTLRPRCEPKGPPLIAHNRQELGPAARQIVQQYAQEAIIETALDGPEIRVSLLGNHSIECLPLLQEGPSRRERICPAPVDHALADRIRDYARRAYVAAGCRDYARVDVRLTPAGEPCIVRIRSLGILAPRGSFARSAEAGGYPFHALVQRIVELAWARYGAAAAARHDSDARCPLAPITVAPALEDERRAARAAADYG